MARSRRRQASTAGKASGPGDQARPRGLKPRGAAAAAARCVPSRRQRSSRATGDRSLSGAGDQAGGCSGLQGGDPRGGTGWYLHLGPAPVCHSVYPVRCPANAPERDVLRRSPPTGCVVGLGYHTSAQCFTQRRCWLRLSQFSRPSCTTLAAPILELGSMSVPSPNIRVLARVARARVPSPRDMARIPSATPESLDNTVCGPRQAPLLVEPFRLTPRLWLAPVSAKRVVCPVCARQTQKARKAHPLASRHSSNHH